MADFLDQLSSSYEPLAQGRSAQLPNVTPSIPGLSALDGGLFTNPLQSVIGQAMLSAYGVNPAAAPHGMNVQDMLWKQQEYAVQQEMIRAATALEREQYLRTAQGMAALGGVGFGPAQRAAFNANADMVLPMVAPFAPMIAPYMDQMAGQYGSPMAMAAHMSTAAPFRFDAITGQLGTRASTMAFQQQEMFDGLYSYGNMADMYGVRAGDLGGMYAEMSRRGMLPGGDVRREALASLNPDRLNRLAAQEGVDMSGGVGALTGSQLNQLMQSDVLRNEVAFFDVDRVKDSMKQFSEVVAAMRDLMGANGEPDAPIGKIMRNLSAISQGMTSQLGAGEIAEMVRNTHQLTQITGMPIDSAMMLQGHAASRLSEAGLPVAFAPQLMQGSLAMGGAMRGVGMAPAWGLSDVDQLQQIDLNLRVGAANSEANNRIGAFLRARESMGGFSGRAEEIADAIIHGDASAAASLGESDFFSLLQGQGVSEGMASSYLYQRGQNQRLSFQANVPNLLAGAEGQGSEVRAHLRDTAENFLFARLQERGVPVEQARAQAARAAGAGVDEFFMMSQADRADPAARNAALARSLGGQLGIEGAEAGLLAEGFYGELEWSIPNSSYRGFGSLQNVGVLYDSTIRSGEDQINAQARARAALQRTFQGIGSDSTLRNIMTAIQNAKPGSDMNDIIRGALGDVGTEELLGRSGRAFEDVARLESSAQDILEQLSGTSSPEERAALQTKYDEVLRNAEKAKTAALAGLRDSGIQLDDVRLEQGAIDTAATEQDRMVRMAGKATRGSASAYEKFWNSDEGEAFKLQAEARQTSGTELMHRVLNSESGVRDRGAGAISAARAYFTAEDRLKYLADEYASGDVRRLQALDLNDLSMQGVVGDQLRELQRQQSDAIESINEYGEDKTGQARARSLLRAEGKEDKFDPKLAAAIVSSDKLTEGMRIKLRQRDDAEFSLRKATSMMGIDMQDAIAAAKGSPTAAWAEQTNETLKERALAEARKYMAAEGGASAQGQSAGLNLDQINDAWGYERRLSTLQERESGIQYGRGTDLLSEFEGLAEVDLDESDSELAGLAQRNQGLMRETINDLRTIRRFVPGDQAKQFLSEWRSAFDTEKRGSERQTALDNLRKKFGISSEDEMESIRQAVTRSSGKGLLDILGDDEAIATKLRDNLVKASEEEQTRKIVGEITIKYPDGRTETGDLSGRENVR